MNIVEIFWSNDFFFNTNYLFVVAILILKWILSIHTTENIIFYLKN